MANSDRTSDLDREVKHANPTRVDGDLDPTNGVEEIDPAEGPGPVRVDPSDPNGQNGTPGWIAERQTNPNQEVPKHPEVPGGRMVRETVKDPIPAEQDPKLRPPPSAVPETRAPIGAVDGEHDTPRR